MLEMEKMNKVGYLGPEGTYSQSAAQKYTELYRSELSLIPCKTVPSAFHKMCVGEVEEIVLPVENSIEGTVNITLDMLYLHPQFSITRELIISINHCLLSKEELPSHLEVILSHPQALAQCQNYLSSNFPNVELKPVESTAKAAITAADEKRTGAIASPEAGEKYGLKILQRAIQDYRANLTSFLVISRQIARRTGEDKTSLVVALPKNKPGGLYSILGILADYRINLTKIQSRPTKEELGEYMFFIDFEGHLEDDNIKTALEILRQRCSLFRILGSYPEGGKKQ